MAFVWELNKETIHLPLGCLQGGVASVVRVGTGVGRFPGAQQGKECFAAFAGQGTHDSRFQRRVSVLKAPPAQNYSYLSITLPRLLPRLPVACEGGVAPPPPPSRAEERLGGYGDWGGVPRRHVWVQGYLAHKKTPNPLGPP